MKRFLTILAILAAFVCNLRAADLYMPSGCENLSACNTAASSGDTVYIADGTYNQAVSGLKAGVTFQAVNDGEVTFTSTFQPGSNGFTMRGIIIKSSNEKNLGGNNTYDRMSFVGGPASGNIVNSLVYNGTTITNSAFYGEGGRYLLLAYEQTGGTITLDNIIFRPDGGWAGYSNPQAALNYYNSNGLVASGLILIDAITTATSEEVIGGLGCNSHVSVGSCGTIAESAITGCDQSSQYYGRFYADGNGNVSMTLDNVVVYDNTSTSWSITRNVDGKTTILKATVDGTIEDWDGTAHSGPTGAADFVLDGDFLNDTRWTNEMCDDEGVSRGVCATAMEIGDYVADATGLDIDGGEADTTDPTCTITSPTSSSTHETSSSSLGLGGTASDNVGVTSVTWSCDVCGSGAASGTTEWTITGITLQEGDNVITVTAHDAATNTGQDVITVTYTPPAATKRLKLRGN